MEQKGARRCEDEGEMRFVSSSCLGERRWYSILQNRFPKWQSLTLTLSPKGRGDLKLSLSPLAGRG